MAQQINSPFGNVATATMAATGTLALTIANQMTIVDGVTTEGTGNRTIDLTINSDIKAGARLFLRLKTNGTETTIFGTGMQGATLTGAAGKTKNVEFVYNGTNFVEAGTPVQID